MKLLWRKLSRWTARLQLTRFTSSAHRQGTAFVEFIESNSISRTVLLEELFRFTILEIQTAERSEVNLNQVLQSVTQKLQPQMEARGVFVQSDLLPTITAHRPSIEQVFEDILAYITSHVKDKPSQKRTTCIHVEGNLLKTGGYQFRIVDKESGMSKDELADSFNIYRTTGQTDLFATHGLGMVRALRIINTYGGAMEVKSEKDQSKSFVFTLPEKQQVAQRHSFTEAHPDTTDSRLNSAQSNPDTARG